MFQKYWEKIMQKKLILDFSKMSAFETEIFVLYFADILV